MTYKSKHQIVSFNSANVRHYLRFLIFPYSYDVGNRTLLFVWFLTTVMCADVAVPIRSRIFIFGRPYFNLFIFLRLTKCPKHFYTVHSLHFYS